MKHNKLLKSFTYLLGATFCMLFMLLQGCYKDKGNYTLHPINEVTIKDSASSKLIALRVGDTLKLHPIIESTEGKTDADYIYEWSVYDNTPSSDYNLPRTVIDSSRNISYVIKGAPFTLGQNYQLTFKVTDKQTGVSAYGFYSLLISNDLREGWLVLENDKGHTDMSIVLPTDTIIHHLYTDRNAATPLGEPLRLELTLFDVTDGLSTAGKRMYLVAKGNAVELNYLTFEKKFDYANLFFKVPGTPDPSYVNWHGYLSGSRLFSSAGVIIDNGKLHYNLVGGFPGAKMWGAELLNPSGSLNYQLFPFVAGGITYSSAYPMVVYDNVGKCFYTVSSTALGDFPASASDDIFNMNHVGMELINMDSSNVLGQYNTIFKSGNAAWYIKFSTEAKTDAPVVTLAKNQITDPTILTASSFTSSTTTPHIYYSLDNAIFRYETTSNTNLKSYTFPASEKITKLSYRKGVPGALTPYLMVATYDGQQGKLYVFPIDAVGNLKTPIKTYKGFSKIVDVNFKVS